MSYATKNHMSYFDVRLVRDAKFFEAQGDKPAAVYLTFVHGVKEDGLDTFVDARIVRGAKLLANLKKGDDMVVIHGELTFKAGKDGEVRGMIWDASAETKINLKARAAESVTADTIPEMPATNGAPAFD